MFERFTDRSRRAIVLAEEEARDTGQAGIRPEHLLMGLVHEGDGVAAKVLGQHGVTLEALRVHCATTLSSEKAPTKLAKPPFTPRSKKALELSLREALRLGHNYIGTEHILLGLVRQSEGEEPSWLADAVGFDPKLLRVSTEDVLRQSGAGHGRSPALDAAMRRSRAAAGRSLMTTGHLLSILAEDARSMAGTALDRLGVTKDAVEAQLAEIDVEETTDAAPKPQPVEIRLGDGRVVTVEDLVVARALSDLDAEQIGELLRKSLGRRRRLPPG